MHTGFARCRIETSGKNILLATDMLDNAHLDQPVQTGLHLLIQRSFIHDIFYVLKWMFKIVCITIISYCARFTATYVSFR